jgi:hypothetical protein
MNRDKLAEEFDEDLLFLDPPEQFDPCIVGVASRCGMDSVVVYDQAKVIESLVQDGMEKEDAIAFFDYNIAGAYVGERTPMFLSLPELH